MTLDGSQARTPGEGGAPQNPAGGEGGTQESKPDHKLEADKMAGRAISRITP